MLTEFFLSFFLPAVSGFCCTKSARRNLLSQYLCLCVCMCEFACFHVLVFVGRGWAKYANPSAHSPPPRGGDVETSEKQGAAKLFYANLLCSFFLFATLIFVYFRLRTTPAEREKKGKWGREKLGKSQPPRKRKWRHKQAASSRRKIS